MITRRVIPFATRKGETHSNKGAGPYRLAWRRLVSKPMGRVCLSVVILYVTAAIVAPFLPIPDPSMMVRNAILHAPSWHFLAGTDQFGRDILSRVIYGIRVSLAVSVSAVVLASVVGVSAGVFTGWSGSWLSVVILRACDSLLAFPTLLLAISIAATTGSGAFNASLALAIVSVPQFARIARAGVLVERNKDYVAAAVSFGAGQGRIMFRHVLPNITAPVLVQLALSIAYAVLVESSLSFLGLGVQPPEPSLGSMLAEGRAYFHRAPWFVVAPGITLTALLFAFNTLSDAIRDVLDPRFVR